MCKKKILIFLKKNPEDLLKLVDMCEIEHEIWQQKSSPVKQVETVREGNVESVATRIQKYSSNPLDKLGENEFLDDSSPNYLNFKKIVGSVDLKKKRNPEHTPGKSPLSPESTFKIYDLSLKIRDDNSKFNLTEDENVIIKSQKEDKRFDRDTIKFKNERLNDMIKKRSNIFNREENKALTDREGYVQRKMEGKGNIEYIKDENAIVFDSYKNGKSQRESMSTQNQDQRKSTHTHNQDEFVTFRNSKVSKKFRKKKKLPQLEIDEYYDNQSQSSRLGSFNRSKNLRLETDYSTALRSCKSRVGGFNYSRKEKKRKKKRKSKLDEFCTVLTRSGKKKITDDYKKAALLMLKRDKYANRAIRNQGLKFLNPKKKHKSSLILFKHKHFSECNH